MIILLLIIICPAVSILATLLVWKQIYVAKIRTQTKLIIDQSISILLREKLKSGIISKCIQYYQQHGEWKSFLDSQGLISEERKWVDSAVAQEVETLPG